MDAKKYYEMADLALCEKTTYSQSIAAAAAQVSIAISLHRIAEAMQADRVEALRRGCVLALGKLKGSDREHALVDYTRPNYTISDLLREALGMDPDPLVDPDLVSETDTETGSK